MTPDLAGTESAVLTNSAEQTALENGAYRKISLRLASFLFICWILNYLDRVNISFAQSSLKHDLGLSDAAYGLGISLFFIGYVLFEVPSTLLMKKIGARKTMTRILVLWGIFSTAMAFVQSTGQFYILRVLLGASEAGFWPCVILYLSYWYPSGRRARITSRLLVAIAASGIIGGPLSGYILQNLGGVGGMHNWQWLFLIEGIPAILAGVIGWFYLTDRPQQAKWLTEEERDLIIRALDAESKTKLATSPHTFLKALRDPRIYVMGIGWATIPVLGTIVNYWMPILIKQTGVSNLLHVGLLSAIPNIIGAIAMVSFARHSDMKLERRWHFFLLTAAGAVAAMLMTVIDAHWQVAIVCLSVIAASYLSAGAIFWTMPPGYLRGEAAAGGIGIISSMGQCCTILVPLVFSWAKTVTGSYSNAILVVAAVAFVGGLVVLIGVPKEANAREIASSH